MSNPETWQPWESRRGRCQILQLTPTSSPTDSCTWCAGAAQGHTLHRTATTGSRMFQLATAKQDLDCIENEVPAGCPKSYHRKTSTKCMLTAEIIHDAKLLRSPSAACLSSCGYCCFCCYYRFKTQSIHQSLWKIRNQTAKAARCNPSLLLPSLYT